MSDASFQDILNTQIDSIKPPVALPVGTYLAIVDGLAEFVKVGVKQTPAANFNLKPVQPQDDVNQAMLLEALDGKSLQDKKIRFTLFLTKDAEYRVKQFLVDHLGLDGKGKSIGQLISEAPGRQVMITVGHRSSEDGTRVFNDVKGTARV